MYSQSIVLEVHGRDDDHSHSCPDSESSGSSASFTHEQGSENVEKDLMMVRDPLFSIDGIL